MQNEPEIPGVTTITPTANIRTAAHGGRAKCLQRLIRLGLPEPHTQSLDIGTVSELAAGSQIDTAAIIAASGPERLVSVRPSSGAPDWGGPPSILNIGMNDARHAELTARLGAAARARILADCSFARRMERIIEVYDSLESD